MPLGVILQQAGLVSAHNVKEALQQQRQGSTNLRVGEILASKGYIDSKTADFFAESLPILITETPKKPIGQYLKEAKLLTEDQIQIILQQQKKSQLKFGEQAVVNGLLAKTTVDFFLRCLKDDSAATFNRAKASKLDPFDSMKQVHDSFYQIKLKLLNLEDREDYYETVLKKVLLWTEGQSCLTQKLFKLIADNQDMVIAGKEAEQVDHLVHTKVLRNWRKQAVSDHLLAIEDRLINNKTSQPIDLLRLYQKILTTTVAANNDKLQQELIKTGLVVKQQNNLAVANRIYKYVFDFKWIEEKIIELKSEPKPKAVTSARSNALISTPKEREKENKLFSVKNLLLLLTLFTLMLVFFNNLSRKIRIRTAFKKGNQLLQQKSFERAIAEYNNLLDIDSNYFQAWTNRGYALAGLQKYDEMRESCSTATIINPRAVYAWNCQGEALHNLKREAEAVAVFDRAIALDKTDPIFSINKSESLKSLGKEEESLATISEAIEVLEQIERVKGKQRVKSEFAVALTFLANGYRKQGQYEPAIFNYNRALEYSPNYFSAQLGKGIILNRVKRYQQAQEEFENILQNKELSALKQAQTWFYLGKNLCQSGQNDKSITAFERAIELKPNYQAAKEAKNNCK